MSDRQAIKAGKEAITAVHRNYHNEVRANRAYRAERAKGIFTGILTFLLLCLLVINIYKVSMGNKSVSFSGMIQFFSSYQDSFSVPNLSVLLQSFTMSNEWAILDGFRIFLNGLGSIIGVFTYLALNLVYTITFASKFLLYILG